MKNDEFGDALPEALKRQVQALVSKGDLRGARGIVEKHARKHTDEVWLVIEKPRAPSEHFVAARLDPVPADDALEAIIERSFAAGACSLLSNEKHGYLGLFGTDDTSPEFRVVYIYNLPNERCRKLQGFWKQHNESEEISLVMAPRPQKPTN